jgi:hypothetical protein
MEALKQILGARSWPRIKGALHRTMREEAQFLRGRLVKNARPLVKDPIALFSSEWYAAQFDAQVIVLIRNPAAFVSSIKRLNWTFDFSQLLSQRGLIDKYLGEYESDIAEFAESARSIVEQGAFLWVLIHHVVDKYRDNHPDWMFVRHEDIAREPVQAFGRLFEYLGLEYSETIQGQIRSMTDSSNPGEAPEGVAHQLKRDSRSSLDNWMNRLTQHDFATICDRVDTVAGRFYEDSEWKSGFMPLKDEYQADNYRAP